MALIVVVAVVQLLFTEAELVTVLLVAVTLAVAAVPEGLPAVVTLTLALGSRKMAERNALVRRLPVVESLGSVDTIVTDKTGTLTENRMSVERLCASGRTYELTGTGTEAGGELRRNGEKADLDPVEPVLACGATCNDAERFPDAAGDGYRGDPTEVALLVAAAAVGVGPRGERIREIPFSSERKLMSVVVDGDAPTLYAKGAPEVVLARCDRVLEDGEVRPLADPGREAIAGEVRRLAGEAYRVLAFARREEVDAGAPDGEIETGLVFLGLQAMIDPPRPGVREAVADCRSAGIRVVMMTGDNPGTARAIGEDVGFDPGGITTGPELDGLEEAGLADRAESCEIFARVSPGHKVRVLEALRERGHRVAMTGDGVNDAPALQRADVGIAMGIRGTDVAKEASDMVLRDDDFATIRDAIAEGRGIFENIRKFVNFLLSANAGEVLTVFAGILLGSALFPERFAAHSDALILTPVMLLWINFVTDGLPALALGADPRAAGIMDRPPRPREEPVLDGRTVASIAAIAASVTGVGLLLFFDEVARGGGLVGARTLLFTFFVVAEMAVIQVIRSRYGLSIRSNRWLLLAVVSSLALHLLVLYTPAASLFEVSTISPGEWLRLGVAVAVAGSVTAALGWSYGRLRTGA